MEYRIKILMQLFSSFPIFVKNYLRNKKPCKFVNLQLFRKIGIGEIMAGGALVRRVPGGQIQKMGQNPD